MSLIMSKKNDSPKEFPGAMEEFPIAMEEGDLRACDTELDPFTLAQEAFRAGLIGQNVLDHLTSLQPQVPNSKKLRYLLVHMYSTVNKDKQLFTRMVQVFIKSQSHAATATTTSSPISGNLSISTEHIPSLAELLVPYASEWWFIGTALKFKPQDLRNIKACLMVDLKSCLLKILEDWIERKHKHTLEPTLNNLAGALNSRLVGLGVVACELKESIALKQNFSPPSQALRSHFTECVDLRNGKFLFVSGNRERMEIEEKGSVLLEIQVRSDEPVHCDYKWLVNGMPLTENASPCCPSVSNGVHLGITAPILCISNADIEMDGSIYSCEVSNGKSKIRTRGVTLKVTCPLDQYTVSLASMYWAQPDILEDVWPPVSSAKHIKVSLIRREKVVYGTQYVHHTLRGSMDDILKDTQRVEYNKVLKHIKSKHLVSIEGRPGSGKTEFIHKITRDWSVAPCGVSRLVLLVSLSDLNKPNLDLLDILSLFKDLKVSKELLEDRDGKGVCFIFDGLDKFSPQDGEKSVVYKIISKEYLSQSSVIVASRPAAAARIRRRANKVIEVLGFTHEQISEYFDHFPFVTSLKSKDLKAYLRDHPSILHMCYLPIHATMVAYLFIMGEVPKTETEVYTYITLSTLTRGLGKVGAISTDMHNLDGEERLFFNRTCKLALEMTLANKQVLCQDEVKLCFQGSNDSCCSGDNSLGLITVDLTADLYGFKNTYSFVHLTFQQYLAAYHISTLDNKEQLKLIQMHGGKAHMTTVWKFYCGLVKFDVNDGKFEALGRMILPNVLFLVQSTYESQQPVACNLLLRLLELNLAFEGQNLTTFDLTALGYIMAKSSSPTSLSFKDCSTSIEAVNAMLSESDGKNFPIHSLRYCSDCVNIECFQKLVNSSVSLKVLDVSSRNTNNLSSATFDTCTGLTTLRISNLCIGPDNLQTVLCNCGLLQELVLTGSIGNSDVRVLADNLKKCKSLKVLDVSNNGLDAKLLASGLSYCSHLETLIINDNGISCMDAEVLLQSLRNCKLKVRSKEWIWGNIITMSGFLGGLSNCCCLQELYLWNVEPADSILLASHCQKWPQLTTLELDQCADLNFASGLKHLTSLKVLRMSRISSASGDNIATILASGVARCTNLMEFVISHSDIGDKQTSSLAGALSRCKKLHTLGFSYCGIRNDGAEATAAGARQMILLKNLDLSGNFIESNGVETAVASLRYCTNLSSLNLNENYLGKEGATAIVSCLHYWPYLQALCVGGTLGKTNIGKNGAVVLAKNLFYCTKLRNLDLSYNGIDEESASLVTSSLAMSKNLAELNLEGNPISRDSCSLSALRSKKCLCLLS